MPLRLLGYIVEILLHHHANEGLPLPPVVGFVLHQGPDRWTQSTAFEDLFSLDAKGLAKGREEGRVRGEFIGRIRLLEELLRSAPTPPEELLALSEDGLRERCENLQRRYGAQRENGSGRD